jgi:hypothetical protein
VVEVLHWVSLCAASLCAAVLAIYTRRIFAGHIFSIIGPALWGGPISIGLLLSPGWRGVIAGLVTVIASPAIWYLAGFADEASGFPDIDLLLGLAAATVVMLLEIITGDVRGQAEIVGLGIGFAVGLFLVLVENPLVGPFHYKGNDALMLFSLYPPNALVWLTTLFFPELVSRKVGWGASLSG